MTRLRLGTRASKLALVQSRAVAAMLERANADLSVELVEVSTKGDRDQSSPLDTGTGWFTRAIQQALLDNRVDIAVHSYKDLPTKQPAGLVIGAVPAREDPRDALVSARGLSLDELQGGAVVGTSSPRREAQLHAMRPDLQFRTIRGNVETRLAKVEAGEYDATVLALAGLRRLGLEDRATQVFTLDQMLPAPAQGALVVECREADREAIHALNSIQDAVLTAPLLAERTFMAALEAGCRFPAGAYAVLDRDSLYLEGLVARGDHVVRGHATGPADGASDIGTVLARELLERAGLRPS